MEKTSPPDLVFQRMLANEITSDREFYSEQSFCDTLCLRYITNNLTANVCVDLQFSANICVNLSTLQLHMIINI